MHIHMDRETKGEIENFFLTWPRGIGSKMGGQAWGYSEKVQRSYFEDCSRNQMM